MSTSSSATSTELSLPEDFDTKEFFSNKKENSIIIVTAAILGLFMWSISPGVGIQALSFAVIYALAAMSLNYHVGVTGIVNFGVVGFFAVGAYAVSLAILLGWNWFSALIIGIIITTIVSFVIAKATLNLREDYFAIITITIGEILRYFFQNEGWIVYPVNQQGIFGGSNGLVTNNPIRSNLTVINILNVFTYSLGQHIAGLLNSIHSLLIGIGVPATTQINIGIPNWYTFSFTARVANLFSFEPIDIQNLIYLIVLVISLILAYLIYERIYNSPVGRLNKAVREDDLSVESTGVNVFNTKMTVFLVGNILIALAGGFFAFELGSIEPQTDFLPILTFYIWAIVVLGGISNYRGVILGGVIFGITIPLVANISLRSEITNLFGSLMNPIVPSILEGNILFTGLIIAVFFIIGIFIYINRDNLSNDSLLTKIELIVGVLLFLNILGNLIAIILPSIKTSTNIIYFDFTWFLNLLTNPISYFNVLGLLIPLSSLALLMIAIILLVIANMQSNKIEVQTDKSKEQKRLQKILVFIIPVLVTLVFLANVIIAPSQTFIIKMEFTTLFLLSTFVLIVIFVALWIVFVLDKYNNIQLSNKSLLKKIEFIAGVLLLLNLIPAFAHNLPILPKVIFNQYNVAQSLTFVPISTFFTTLDPNLARIMILGIVLMAFILFKPEGILKEKTIKTVNAIEEYRIYYKTHVNAIDSDLNIPKSELPEDLRKQDELLSTKDLTKNFGGVVGLDKVSVSVKRGSLLGVIGPNGSGKSTFFNVLTGLLEQDKNEEGEIKFLNKDITFYSISQRAQLGMGRTFQQSRLFKNLTVLENVLVAAKGQKGTKLINALLGNWKTQEKELHQQAFQVLQYLNILHIWNNKASDISGGQQKLVSLARALMSQSHIILLDEPVAGVNPTLAKKIFEKIQTLHQKEGQHYIIIEHNMDVQLGFCDQIYVFNKGQIVAEGTPDEIRKNESVLDAYLGH